MACIQAVTDVAMCRQVMTDVIMCRQVVIYVMVWCADRW